MGVHPGPHLVGGQRDRGPRGWDCDTPKPDLTLAPKRPRPGALDGAAGFTPVPGGGDERGPVRGRRPTSLQPGRTRREGAVWAPSSRV